MISKQNSYIGSVLLDFPIQPNFCSGDGQTDLVGKISYIMAKKCGEMAKIFSSEVVPGNSKFGMISLLTAAKGVTTTIKTYPERQVATVTIEYDINEFNGTPLLSFKDIEDLELEMAEAFQAKKKTAPLPQIKRALDFDTYFTTSDVRLLEYDIKEMLFDGHSDFQHVQIGRSGNYGNILILDGLVNLAESDLAYTESIMCRGKVDYTGKDVLILGGGDGALLYELRKENANSITMIEIDDMVMKACKVHLRKACEDTLDNYKCENYEIIVGDCIPFMEKCKLEERTFDFIFGDLTDIPISTTPQGEIWDFFTKTLQLSFGILKPSGIYFTHANGISATESLEMFENTIKASLEYPVVVEKTMEFVPSFKEKWVFFQVQRK